MQRKEKTSHSFKEIKRRKISLAIKEKILRLSEEGIRHCVIAQHFSLPRTTVQAIVKQKDKLRKALKNSALLKTTIARMKDNLITEMEKKLNTWIQDRIQFRVPLNLSIIQSKALSIHNALKNSEDVHYEEKGKTFTASRGWFLRFKARYALDNIFLQEDTINADTIDAQNFLENLKEIVENKEYSPRHIFNVDETCLLWKKMSINTCISPQARSDFDSEAAKDRLTLMLGSNAEGDFKLKPLLIYRAENPRALKNFAKGTLPVIWRSNLNTSMTGAIFEEWFTQHFIPEVKQYCLRNNLEYKALLLVDNHSSHLPRIAEIDSRIQVVFLPSTVSQIQPMEQGVISSFKAYYLRRIFSQAVRASEKSGTDLKEFQKNYNILQGVKNIAASWQEVKASSLRGVWKKVCPYYFLDEGENSVNAIQPNVDEIVNDVARLAKSLLQIEVAAEDIEELMESKEQETSEAYIEWENQKIGIETLEDDTESQDLAAPVSENQLTVKKLSEAFTYLEKAMDIFEENDPNFDRSFEVNKKLLAASQCYRDMHDDKEKEAKINPVYSVIIKEEQF